MYTLGKTIAKNTNRYTHKNNVCKKVETENMNYISYKKSCCDGKQINAAISGYLIDVKGRFKGFIYIKKSLSQMTKENFLSICLLLLVLFFLLI